MPVQPVTVQVPAFEPGGTGPATMPVTVRPALGASANSTPVAALPPLFVSVTV
jgi:hypothetical protein